MEEKIKYRVMLPLTLGLLMLMIIFGYTVYHFQESQIHSEVMQQLSSTTEMLQQEIDQDSELISGMLDFIEQDENLRQAWLAGDRQQLLEISLPIFEHIRSEYRVTHFYFHGIDRVNFLRVHSPNRNGDFIDRYTMSDAATAGKTANGIELGPLGTFTLRVVRPWLIGGELVGYIELGEEIEHVIRRLRKTLNLEFLILIDKQYIDREKWLNGLQMMNRHENWEEYGKAAVIFRTLDIPAEQIRDSLFLHHTGQENIMFSSKILDQHFHSGFAPLTDAGGRTVGDIITFHNTTDQKKYLSRLLRRISLISILTAMVILVLFWIYLSRIENKLKISRNLLIDSQKKQAKINVQLRESEEDFRSIINNMQDVFYRTDSKGKLVLISPSGVRLLGYESEEELLGRDVTVLYTNHDDRQDFLKTLKNGSGRITNYELNFNRKDGTTLPVIVSGATYFDKGGKSRGVEGTFSDISVRKDMENELLQTRKLESVGQLAAGIAHEINTPAQFLGTNIDFLNESFDDVKDLIKKYQHLVQVVKNGAVSPEILTSFNESVEELDWEYLAEEIPLTIEQSRQGVERISIIVRAMKEFSHPGSKNKAPTNINDIINTTIIVASNEWKYVAEVDSDLAPDLPSVTCLANEMGQVFLNILVNAAHAIKDKLGEMPEDERGLISFSSRLDGEWIEICINDNGKGMPDSVKAHIFDPFFTTKEVGKGTGQGLSIAYSVVTDKHQGSLSCKSEEGVGTSFIIRLPIAA